MQQNSKQPADDKPWPCCGRLEKTSLDYRWDLWVFTLKRETVKPSPKFVADVGDFQKDRHASLFSLFTVFILKVRITHAVLRRWLPGQISLSSNNHDNWQIIESLFISYTPPTPPKTNKQNLHLLNCKLLEFKCLWKQFSFTSSFRYIRLLLILYSISYL